MLGFLSKLMCISSIDFDQKLSLARSTDFSEKWDKRSDLY